MGIRKVKLSDTQAHVIAWSTITDDVFMVFDVRRSSRATFRKLYELGLITEPVAGAYLTLEGMNVRTSLTADPLQRVFFISDVVSHNAYEIQPVNSAPVNSVPVDADIQRAEGVQRIMAKVNAARERLEYSTRAAESQDGIMSQAESFEAENSVTLIYRVAKPAWNYPIPVGPYHYYTDSVYPKIIKEMYNSHANFSHPTPKLEGWYIPYDHVCGFESIEELYEWFEGYTEDLHELGFKVYIYSVPTHLVTSLPTQCMTPISDMSLFDIRPLQGAYALV